MWPATLGEKGALVNPKNLKYHKEHDWARIEGDIAVLGVTDYAQEALGDIVYIELPEVGTEVAAGTTYAEIESVKAVTDVYAPLSGTIVETNEEVVDAPELINESPYEDGWLIKIKLSDPSELEELMSAEEYEQILAEQDE
ncbi:MAG: glycine cleavage system protein GcvH [Actinobacteria bacterium]|nr:glycine cleavage system protein GcvH [Actinomycetota bacterium]